ncbi:hypothetical protein BDV98DRAFT_557867 [Pterulicium gracile]|uniref:Uncharacterized protein n=1 Tax=Pterulicium gracile TaxID=1884261 RepID=A0A5C3R3V2_9AGAR|nr:hypothetical protein BDV98DRAFT_557867 [Pterula gracilis]
MEPPDRRQTLEALQLFADKQRRLLSQTKLQLERLHELKQKNEETLTCGLDTSPPRLSDCYEASAGFPAEVDWSAFEQNGSTTPLRSFQRAQDKGGTKAPPASYSYLQSLVKTCRKTMIDPILAECALHSDPEPESEEELDPETLLRQHEHQKIRDLKMRTVRSCGLTIPLHSHMSNAVYIRHDLEDETAEVSIGMEDDDPPDEQPFAMHALPSPSPPPAPPSKSAKKRPAHRGKTLKHLKALSSRKTHTPPASSPPHLHAPPVKEAKSSRGAGRPKSETYKQAWSDSEQNLLERLLEEIPEGEKNRWSKISKAMNGRRTPKQVASRVQKYFEKLKRFGVQ